LIKVFLVSSRERDKITQEGVDFMSRNTNHKLGLIDIGSNTIRLVILEYDGNAQTLYERHVNRLVDESKRSIRLAEKTLPDGTIELEKINELAKILTYFRKLCELHQTHTVRAVATAAIRNAKNRDAIIDYLQEASGLRIEVLSGHDEAYAGFVGVMNTIAEPHGFVLDIGGGSTEITFFYERKLMASISLPIGAVNGCEAFTNQGMMSSTQIIALEKQLDKLLADAPWISAHPGLPLIGLGGTVRTAAKIHQAISNHSFAVTHQYELHPSTIAHLAESIIPLTVEQRKKVENLGKDRADLIAPGLIILRHIIQLTRASRLLVSGSGLRDGLFALTTHPEQPLLHDLAAYRKIAIAKWFPTVNERLSQQLQQTSSLLFQFVTQFIRPSANKFQHLFELATMLHSVGTNINFYQQQKHTHYFITNTRIDGLSHREIVCTALLASYRSKNRLRQAFLKHLDLLAEEDFEEVLLSAVLLQFAIAITRYDLTNHDKTVRYWYDQSTNEWIIKSASANEHAAEWYELTQAIKELQKCITTKIRIQF
jgi:exopolyphosphatase/guanosine-5'-triphosphate,3'-diphosphate pyrophosphatase